MLQNYEISKRNGKKKTLFSSPIPPKRTLLDPLYHPDADFVEQVEGDGDQNESHQVGGSDDGSNHHDSDKGMATVSGKNGGGE
jgi:hypothetical protein